MTTASVSSAPPPPPTTTATRTHQVEGMEAVEVEARGEEQQSATKATGNNSNNSIDIKKQELAAIELGAAAGEPKSPATQEQLKSPHAQEQPPQMQSIRASNSKMMSSCCAGCREPIRDRFIFSVIDLHWHQDCVQCSDCSLKLIERCYEISGKLYCKLDYWRRFGPKCFGCREPIERSELVQRIKGNRVFHLKCFTCSDCNRQLKAGEQLHLIDGKRLLCKQDYNQTTTTTTSHHNSSNSNNNNHNTGNKLAAINNNNSNITNTTKANGDHLLRGSPNSASSATTAASTYFTLTPSGNQANQSVAIEAIDKSGNSNNKSDIKSRELRGQLDELGEEIEGELDEEELGEEDEFDDDELNEDDDEEDEDDNQDQEDDAAAAAELMDADEQELRLRSFSSMSDDALANGEQERHLSASQNRLAAGSYDNLENEENRRRRGGGAKGKLALNSAQAKRKRRRKRGASTAQLKTGHLLGGGQPNKKQNSRNGESILNSVGSVASVPPASSILAASAASPIGPNNNNNNTNHKSVSSAASTSSNSSSASSSLAANNQQDHHQHQQQQQQQQHSHHHNHNHHHNHQQHSNNHHHNHHHHHHNHLAHQQPTSGQEGVGGGGGANSGATRGGSGNSTSGGGHKPTRVRTVLNEKQLQTLRDCYAHNPRPDALMKEQLVEMTGLSPRVIRVWFQNKRCKDKKKSILYKQMQQHEKDGRHLAGLTLMRGVPMVASSPIQYDDHSTVSSTLGATGGANAPSQQQAQQQQQQQQQQPPPPHPVMMELHSAGGGVPNPNAELASGSPHANLAQNGPADIHAYQPPWENLIDYAHQHQQSGVAPSDCAIDAASPRYQQLISQVHGYNGNNNSGGGGGNANGNNNDHPSDQQQQFAPAAGQQVNFVALQPKDLQHHGQHQPQQQQQHQHQSQLVHLPAGGLAQNQPQMRQQLHQFGR